DVGQERALTVIDEPGDTTHRAERADRGVDASGDDARRAREELVRMGHAHDGTCSGRPAPSRSGHRPRALSLIPTGPPRRTMMEPHPGVFVSKTSTDDWKLDPDVPGSQMHELVHADGVWAGFTRFTNVEGPVSWTPE